MVISASRVVTPAKTPIASTARITMRAWWAWRSEGFTGRPQRRIGNRGPGSPGPRTIPENGVGDPLSGPRPSIRSPAGRRRVMSAGARTRPVREPEQQSERSVLPHVFHAESADFRGGDPGGDSGDIQDRGAESGEGAPARQEGLPDRGWRGYTGTTKNGFQLTRFRQGASMPCHASSGRG